MQIKIYRCDESNNCKNMECPFKKGIENPEPIDCVISCIKDKSLKCLKLHQVSYKTGGEN